MPNAPARLLPLSRSGLPAEIEPCLDPTDLFASRLWFDLTLAHALPAEATPLLALGGGAVLPLCREAGGRLAALVTPYSLTWRPLFAPGADPRAAGRAIGRLFRRGPPVRLDSLPPEAPGLEPFLAGLGEAGLRLLRYDHFGNWHEALPRPGWPAYFAERPPELRTTIGRKTRRAAREFVFERITSPGPALEAGIAAYEAVRTGSWKPWEPFPDFDGHLLRAVAARGQLRLGVLRDAADGTPVAAQYWVLDHEGRRATVLKLAHLENRKAASPGTALSALMIEGLLEADKVRELDFGRGDDPYKRSWVATRRPRIGVLLVDPLHPAGLLALGRHAAGRLRGRLRG